MTLCSKTNLEIVQNVAEGKNDVRSVNAGQGSSNTELRIIGKSKKLDYLASGFTTLGSMRY